MYLLDASAIAITLKKLKERSVEVLEDKATLDLARYELSNVIWKECTLEGLISSEEAAVKAENIAKILEITKEERVESSKDFRGAMELATKLKLTFYDASYLYVAKKEGFTLITEDKELLEKAKHIKVETLTTDEFLGI